MKKFILPIAILVSLASCQSEVEKLRDTEKQLWTVNDSLNREGTRYDSICASMTQTAIDNGDMDLMDNPIYIKFDSKRQHIWDTKDLVLQDIKKVQDKIKSIELGLE